MKPMRKLICAFALLASSVGTASATSERLDPRLLRGDTQAVQSALVELRAKAARLPATDAGDYLARRSAWIERLSETAQRSQADLLQWLRRRGVEHRAFWIANAVWVQADQNTLREMAERDDVAYVHADVAMPAALPHAEPMPYSLPAPFAVEWGVNRVNAPQVWAAGITGQGIVIAGQDTGYQWNHPVLQTKYRGWNGVAADHNYSWHDAIHDANVGNPCGSNAAAPCDDHNHGTHTMGTMVGDDGGGNQTGVAPGARWIGCRNMASGVGTPTRYMECMQWFAAPTDSAGNNPDPSKAPHVVGNSWGCDASEGCATPAVLEEAVDNVVLAGIMMVAAAGNSGSGCFSITDGPAVYDSAFTIGSTTSADNVSSFSSRGPATGASTNKPDAVAPGSSIRSSIRNNAYASYSGTSMAAPHVAGVAALVMSANPNLKGHPDQVAEILRSTAQVLPVSAYSSQSCGAVPAATIPNPVIGYGRIDAWAAFRKAETIFVDAFDD